METPCSPEDLEVCTFHFEDDGHIPNHPSWPLVVYRAALPAVPDADAWEARFARNGWGGVWRDGIFAYAHYHSTAHEALGVVRGRARVRFGGDAGVALTLGPGDLALLPAGTGHQRLEASADFLVVGAYPHGQEDYDLCTGAPDERPEALRRIRQVPAPDHDPLYGDDGPLLAYWSAVPD